MSAQDYLKIKPVVALMEKKFEDALFSVTGLSYAVSAIPAEQQMIDVLDKMIAKCCAVWNVEYTFIIQKNRGDDRPIMRQIICFMARNKYPRFPLRTIGAKLGGLDHTTVIHCIDKATDHINTEDEKFMGYFNRVKFLLTEI